MRPFVLILVVAALAVPAYGLQVCGASYTYEEASEGLPRERPGNADDAGWTGVRFADLDEDGNMDLVAIGRKGDGARPFLGDGDGVWTESRAGIMPHFSGRSDVALGDVDGDGHVDIVESTGHVWLGDGAGAWAEGPRLPADGEDAALGDVDNDGDLDVAVVRHLVGGIRVFLQDAGGWLDASAGLPTSSGGHKITLADVDADGCLDVVASFWYDGGVWLGDCAGAWTDVSAGLDGFQGWGVDVGDIDGDGHLDLVYGTFHGQDGDGGIRLFLGDGAGGWTYHDNLLSTERWGGLALVDVDGDGDLDIYAGENGVAAGTARVVVLVGDGTGGFNEPAETGLPTAVDELEGLAAADIDGNGMVDVGLAHYGEDGVRVYRLFGPPTLEVVRSDAPLPCLPVP